MYEARIGRNPDPLASGCCLQYGRWRRSWRFWWDGNSLSESFADLDCRADRAGKREPHAGAIDAGISNADTIADWVTDTGANAHTNPDANTISDGNAVDR